MSNNKARERAIRKSRWGNAPKQRHKMHQPCLRPPPKQFRELNGTRMIISLWVFYPALIAYVIGMLIGGLSTTMGAILVTAGGIIALIFFIVVIIRHGLFGFNPRRLFPPKRELDSITQWWDAKGYHRIPVYKPRPASKW